MIILRLILSPFALVYTIIISIRNLLFDIGVFKTQKVNTNVISVGNISVGGTGKTPVVEYLIRYLQNYGLKVAVVSRGYKRKSKGLLIVSDGITINDDPIQSGDEPVQISKKFPEVIVIVSENKYEAAKLATEKFNANVILLDDGFQHRKLHRDFDIVIVDNSKPKLDYFPLPLGYAREPICSLKRADFILFSDNQNDNNLVNNYYDKPYALFTFLSTKFISIFDEKTILKEELCDKKCYAFCGIGKPDSFYKSLIKNEIVVKKFKKFPDHHIYSETEIDKIILDFTENDCDLLITTEKDAVKLSKFKMKFKNVPIYYLEIEAKIIQNENKFLNELDKLIK